jgi:hypothetical protein
MKIGLAHHRGAPGAPPASPLDTHGEDGNGNCIGNRNGNGHGDENDDGGGDWNDDGNIGDGNGNRNDNDPTESTQPEVPPVTPQRGSPLSTPQRVSPPSTPQRGSPLSTPQAPRKRKRHVEGASALARLQEESHKFRTWPTSTKRVSRLGF